MSRERREAGREEPRARRTAPAGPGTLGFVLRFALFWVAALAMLAAVPAIVSQEGQRLRIDEVPVR